LTAFGDASRILHPNPAKSDSLFRIKICGVTSAKDAQLIALAGADAIGLNFYPESPRYIEPTEAEKFATTISPKLARVGVFVNSPPEFMRETASRLKLDFLQLHGDEAVETISQLEGHSVIKVFRMHQGGWEAAESFLNACRERGCAPAAVLIDAAQPGEYGGTGQTIDWTTVPPGRAILGGLPLVLAGGLTPFNVVDAITIARPDAVDVASGVESKPGTKDLMLIRAFVTSAKKAFEALAK
jgi:phosphoribosylanthranilate isomerase